MHRHARVAVRAGCDPTTGAAQQRGSVATTIQEDEHLAVRREMAFDGLHHRGRNAGRYGMRAQIHELQLRRCRLAGAPRQRQASVTPGRNIVQGFQRRSCGPEHHRHLGALCAHQCQVSR